MDALIAKLERRDSLSDEERAVLRSICSPPKRVAADQDLIVEGERPNQSTLMLDGFSARYQTFPDGRRQITAIHMKGDFVDLHSFLLHRMDHGVVALTDCTVTTVPHEALRSITERFPHLTRLLWLSTLIDASIHRRWLATMGRLPAAANLAHLLCELCLRMEAVGLAGEQSYEMPLTQTELGDVLGLSLVHVNRSVQELKRADLISWRGRKLSILDWNRLKEFAEFDSIYLHLTQEPR